MGEFSVSVINLSAVGAEALVVGPTCCLDVPSPGEKLSRSHGSITGAMGQYFAKGLVLAMILVFSVSN